MAPSSARRMRLRAQVMAGLGCFLWSPANIASPAAAEGIADPPVMASSAGVMDLLMVARPQVLPFAGNPAGYVYEICARPGDPNARRCPIAGQNIDLTKCPSATDPAVSPYGGTRLKLMPGDAVRLRLVNCLPPAVDAKHAVDDQLLLVNPTNLHTHGLIVEPHRADDQGDRFGDYVYVIDLPPGVQIPPDGTTHPSADPHHPKNHSQRFDFRKEFVDYEIPISRLHPPGLYWFHPHIHGLSLNQITGGLSGIITLGKDRRGCEAGERCPENKPLLRHLIFKDTQITSDFRVRFQENPDMCATPDAAGQVGACTGKGTQMGTTSEGNDGRWEFTVNGQTYPQIEVGSAGNIWRLANASGSATYNLGLFPEGSTVPLVFQVLAIDGASLVIPDNVTQAQGRKLLGDKVRIVPCRGMAGGAPAAQAKLPSPGPICADSLRMMPSARAEIFVPGDAVQGKAILHTTSRSTGLDGDDWPNIDLAEVVFSPSPSLAARAAKGARMISQATDTSVRPLAPGGIFSGPAMTRISGTVAPVSVSSLKGKEKDRLHALRAARLATLSPDPKLPCRPLPAGKVRQVLFGLPAPKSDSFGLGYRLAVDPGDRSPPSLPEEQKIVAFDHAAPPTVCIPLGPDNARVTETWVLVNLAREDHNFHIHQARFSVTNIVTGDGETTMPPQTDARKVLIDNVPIPSATGDGCDGTVAPWIAKQCAPTFVTVAIEFHEVGDFVYHCHILEHEDGGMMAKISVVPYGARGN